MKWLKTLIIPLMISTVSFAGNYHNATASAYYGTSQDNPFWGGGIGIRIYDDQLYLETKIDSFKGINEKMVVSTGLRGQLNYTNISPFIGGGLEHRYDTPGYQSEPYIKLGVKLFDFVFLEMQRNMDHPNNIFRIGLEARIR